MRVFVTGGRGLVGRNVAERLSPGHEVLAPGRQELDLLDSEAVRRYISKRRPDAIVHCAGIVGGIQANIREPARFLVDNFELGKNVVMAAASVGVPWLLNLGSSCMYPREAPNPLKEEYVLTGELEPTNEGYAIAKVAIQRLCAYVGKETKGLSYKTLLPCNLYGKWDKFDPEHSHMLPAVIRKLYDAKKAGMPCVDIWGSGQARREFMYAGDLAEFIEFAMERFDSLPDLLNVGLGYDHSIDEYYTAVARIVGYTGSFSHDLDKPEGMAQKLVDITRLRSLGWKARTPLETGLELTYQYFLEKEKAI